jgi:hypothetical protein
LGFLNRRRLFTSLQNLGVSIQFQCCQKDDNCQTNDRNGADVLPLRYKEKEKKHANNENANRHEGKRKETHLKILRDFLSA